jgi:hypothetical protein
MLSSWQKSEDNNGGDSFLDGGVGRLRTSGGNRVYLNRPRKPYLRVSHKPINKGYVRVNSRRRPAAIAEVQKPLMALGFYILVTWIRLRGLTASAIQAGMTVLIYFQLLTRT